MSGNTFQCPTCEHKTFKKLGNYKNHVIKCAEENLICPHCGKKFATPSNRNRHVKGVHTADDFGLSKCQFCNMNVHRDREKHDSICKSNPNNYVCMLGCGKKFKSPAGRKRHDDSSTCMHPACRCISCGRLFEGQDCREQRRRHVREWECPKQTCPLCETTLRDSIQAEIHFRERRCAKLKELCQFCHKTFVDREALIEHLRQEDCDPPQPECVACGCTFETLDALDRHTRDMQCEELGGEAAPFGDDLLVSDAEEEAPPSSAKRPQKSLDEMTPEEKLQMSRRALEFTKSVLDKKRRLN